MKQVIHLGDFMRFITFLILTSVISGPLYAERKPVDRSNPWEMMFHPGEMGKILGEAVAARENEQEESDAESKDETKETSN